MFQDLSIRRPALEEMDKPDIAPAALERALRALVRMNTASNTAGLFWPTLRSLAGGLTTNRPLTVLDVGCGSGDMSRRLEQRAAREGIALQVDGCDMNSVAIGLAQRENEAAGCRGRFFVCNVVSEDLPGNYDVILSSLFLHHLDADESKVVLRRMAAHTDGTLLVSDLIRSRAGLLLVYLATRTLTRSPVVHEDGVTSLLAAYSLPEIEMLAAEAGLRGARVSRRWPERFLLTWLRT